ncbi:MAG TPA: DUF4189 domain-containing protein [Flavobacteriaceae bacterium]|nr:DUF4189 domain-containing protein [Flavobacteriaceae bacterium]
MKKQILFIGLAFFSVFYVNAQHASLAIDQKTGDQYGWAVDYETQAAADQRAMAECEKNGGDDCHIVLRFTGGCGAYVVERGNNSLYGWGTGDTRTAAENRALSEARTRGGTDLVVRVWGCNGGNLVASEETKTLLKGVYFFHFTYSDYWKKGFVTKVLFQPNVAQKQGGKWIWTADAEEKMTPFADRFMDVVEEELYGYLGENKDKAYTRKKLDWAGKNEIVFNNSALNLSKEERRKRLEAAVKSVEKICAERGAKLIWVDVEQ